MHYDSQTLQDIGATAFFNRELESVKAQTYDRKFPRLKAADGTLFPINTTAGAGAESITYRSFTTLGMAKIIANYADDLPVVGVAGVERTSPVRGIGEAYVYSLQDIRAAMQAGRPLNPQLATAARRANDQKVNRLAFFGDDQTGLIGLFNNPNIPDGEVPLNAGSTSRRWENKTPDEILTDMNGIETDIVTSTNQVESPDTLLLPVAQYRHIATTARSSTSDTTILQYFLANSAGIRTVEPVNECANVAAFGGNDVMVAYERADDKLTLELPQPFEQLPVQEKNLAFTVPCHSRIGGLIVYYPLSVKIMEGI
jgi:hypothetical protein